MYVILTDADKKGQKWDREEFFRTGEGAIASLLESIAGLGLVSKPGRALDFGCGIGRLTQALAPHFERVDGVDLAPSMIDQARGLNRYGERCGYHVNSAGNLAIFEDCSFDLIYTNIVLQHMEPRFSKNYIREFFRLLQPGGLAVFQAPSHLSPWFLSSRSRWRVRLGQFLAPLILRVPPSTYMYAVPRREIEALIRAAGVDLVAAVEDHSSGPEWVAYCYYVRKPGRRES